MIHSLASFPIPDEGSLETKQILKKLARAHRFLAELKGMAKTIPNERILISTLVIQEAKDSSAIENIFTTHDELFLSEVLNGSSNQSAKEVRNYHDALWQNYKNTSESRVIRFNDILNIQSIIEPNKSGIRTLPGTVIGNANTGEVIYTPPQHPDEITELLTNLVRYINDGQLSELDPLIKMALIHYQFESIHPFYDGNGRTGRILNILYLVQNDLLDLPILYLSRYIVRTKSEYYRLLQSVREQSDWTSWVMYMIEGVETTARETITFIDQIKELIFQTKQRMRTELPRIYSQDILNNLFFNPYTKVQFIVDQIGVTRLTATRYLNLLTDHGFVSKHKIGRTNYFINEPLIALMTQQEAREL